ncbi:gp53-like domain-containing protein [Escherichia coli]|uniref:gp53-like domain-containing protein n=1 Tax=Escherichia coli TaxID=562 RepID=UPI00273F8515|nr:phage tail protein [Escherichia coli]
MATNNFKAFALDPNANVMPQADWEALPALLSGFTAGKASSAQVNKAIRQATTIAALVGQFIANSGADALDNADVNGLVTKFTNALTTNLGLGNAATKNVGTGTNQIPDMNSFNNSLGSSGYQKFPGGLILQWGTANVSGSSGTVQNIDITFPIAFTTAFRIASSVYSTANPSQRFVGIDIGNTSKTKIRFTCVTPTTNTMYWLAFGN